MRPVILGAPRWTRDDANRDMSKFDMLGPRARDALRDSPLDTMAGLIVDKFAMGLKHDPERCHEYMNRPAIDEMAASEIQKRIAAKFPGKTAQDLTVRARDGAKIRPQRIWRHGRTG